MDKPLRIGLVVHSNKSGGAERYLNTLYSGPKPPQATLLGSVPGWAGKKESISFGPKWSRKTMIRGLLRLPHERRLLSSAVNGCNFDAFHLQFKREQIGFTRMLSAQAPVVWTEHGRFSETNRRLLGRAYSRAAQYASAIICVSEEVADDVRSLVGPRVRIEVIRNTVDLSSFSPADPVSRAEARRKYSISEDELAVAWVGRMDPGKLPKLALSTARDWEGRLLMAGTGESEPEIRDLASSSPNVDILGFCDPRTLLEAADVFLFTSAGRGEGLPISIVEACASGLNVVTNSGNGFSNLLEEFGGAVVDRNASPEEWQQAFRQQSSSHKRTAARQWAESTGGIDEWRERHWSAIKLVLKSR